jgi:CheY-like chemotaxis protein
VARTILLVEDNDDDVVLITRIIELAGIQNPLHVLTTINATKKFLGEIDDEDLPVLAIVDIVLPDGSGLDLLRWIRTQGPRLRALPAIVITGQFDRTFERRAHQGGAAMFLEKPLDRELFVSAIVHLGLRQTIT